MKNYIILPLLFIVHYLFLQNAVAFELTTQEKDALHATYRNNYISDKQDLLNNQNLQEVMEFITFTRTTRPTYQQSQLILQKNPWLGKTLPALFFTTFLNPMSAEQLSEMISMLQYDSNNVGILKKIQNIAKSHTSHDRKICLDALGAAWSQYIFNSTIDLYILTQYAQYFSKDDIENKAITFIVNSKFDLAKQLLQYLPTSKKVYYDTLLQKYKQISFLKQQYNIVTKDQRIHSMITYLYLKSLRKSKNYDELIEIVKKLPKKQYLNINWSNMQIIAVRDLIVQKEYSTALQIIQNTSPNASIAEIYELNWLAGFIYFKFLKQPSQSISYFSKMFDIAKTSHSRAQAAYWLGRAYDAIDDAEKKKYWFEYTYKHYPHYFYGQIASLEISHLNADTQNIVAQGSKPDLIDEVQLQKFAFWSHALFEINMKKEAVIIADYAVNISPDTSYTDTFLKNIHDNIPLTIFVAKHLCNSGHAMIKESYPVHPSIKKISSIDKQALYSAIIRQESNFDQEAKSIAGARGIMQIMPFVAAKYSKALGLKELDYLKNADSNIKIGTTLLNKLMTDWNDNYILTIASYNAGKKPVFSWIDTYGDLQNIDNLYDTLDWIEMIPYSETRLYVKKIIENMINYQAIITDRPYTAKNVSHFLNIKKKSQ